MNRFFVDCEIVNNRLEITGDDAHHIRDVLRLKEKESIICVKNRKEFVCDIDKVEKNGIILIVRKELPERFNDNRRITLLQGLPKGDKLEFIIEKAVETGVYKIVPLKLKRSIAKISGNDEKKKISRFLKISKSAAQQSHGLFIPVIVSPATLKQLDYSEFDLKIICYEDELKTSLKSLLEEHENPENIAVVIGPEGGLSEDEVLYLKEKGFISVTLGERILRCETAGIYTIANINYHYSK